MINFSSLYNQGITAIVTDNTSPAPLETYKTPPTRTSLQLKTLDTRLRNKEIGIAILLGQSVAEGEHIVALDIDTDDDLILSACPPSPVSRRGTKGEARFYKVASKAPPVSLDFYEPQEQTATGSKKSNLVVELKACSKNGTGSLCHIPPSPHKPYVWLNGFDSETNPHIAPTADFLGSLPTLNIDQLKKDLAILGIRSNKEIKEERQTVREVNKLRNDLSLVITPEGEVGEQSSTGLPALKAQVSKPTDVELARAILTCLPCEMSYANWRDSAYAVRTVLGDTDGEQAFTEYVNGCPEYAEKESTWIEVHDFFSRDLGPMGTQSLGVGSLIHIAKEHGVDLKTLPGKPDNDAKTIDEYKAQTDSEGNRIYAVNKNFVELANKLVYEYKYFIWLAGCIHAYNKNRWVPVKNTATLEVVLAQVLINNNLNWVAPADENKKYYRTLNLSSQHLANLVKQIQGMVEWSGNEDNYRPNTWIIPPTGSSEEPHVESAGGTIPLQNMLIDILGSTENGETSGDTSGTDNIASIACFKFSPFYLNTSVLPFSFDPEAECPYFLHSLRASFGAESGIKGITEEVIENHISELQKVFGYILSEKFHSKKIFVFAGASNSGKSSIMRVMEELVGSEYVKAGDKKMMNSQFGYENIDKAKLLTMDEYSISFLNSKEVDTFKAITGKVGIRIEPKGKSDYTAVASAVPVLTTNTTPESLRDPGAGLVNRMMFYYMHPLDKMDDDYFDKVKKELPGIFNWALKGALRLLSGESVCQPCGRSAEFKAVFIDSSIAPIERFVTECVREVVTPFYHLKNKGKDPNFLYTKEIQSRYMEWFDNQGYSVKDKQFDSPYSSVKSFGTAFKQAIAGKNSLARITPKTKSSSSGYNNIVIVNISELGED